MSVALVVMVVSQWVLEGFRWQLIPLHLAALGLAIGDLVWDDRRLRGWRRLRRGVLGVPGIALALLLPIVMPIPEIPTPSGPFEVGTMTFVLSDPERIETYGIPEPDPDAAESTDAAEGDGSDGDVGEPRRIVA